MNEVIGTIMKSGFPLLLLILFGMLLISLWQKPETSRSHKWKWTAYLIAPSLLALLGFALLGTSPETMLEGVILGRQPFLPPWDPTLFMIVTYLLVLMPFSGILAWLLFDQ